MKSTPVISKKWLANCLFFVLLLAIGCKKDKSAPINPLYGTWVEETIGANLSRTLHIRGNNIHVALIEGKNGIISKITTIKGTYHTEGNKLFTNFTEIVVQADNKIISKNAYTSKLFENATYEFNDNNQLMLHYTTYPADAPVATTVVLSRQLPD